MTIFNIFLFDFSPYFNKKQKERKKFCPHTQLWKCKRKPFYNPYEKITWVMVNLYIYFMGGKHYKCATIKTISICKDIPKPKNK